MVNELDFRDARILERLREGDGAVSGQALAGELGISRVALWKRIERLKALAYRIEGSHAGYRLRGEDAIAAWEFGPAGDLRCLEAAGSTMDEAWRWAEDGAPSGSLVITGRQSAGRGQHGRSWQSPEGGLYLSLVLRPRLPASHAGGLLLEAGAWTAAWLEERCRVPVRLQWPNDLVVGGRKVGGLLVEMAGSLEAPRHFILGLGVNFPAVGDEPPAGGWRPVGLDEVAPARLRRRELAAAFRDHLRDWSRAPELRPDWWAVHARGLGGPVRVEARPELGPGPGSALRASGFNRQGALLLEGGAQPWILPGETEKVHFPA